MPVKNHIISFPSILRTIFTLIVGVGMFVFPQTVPNTIILNQAKALYQFKTYPRDSINSNVTQFSVLDAPNFELSFSQPDSFVFKKETVTVNIVYKNIGNKIADSASIVAAFPPAGMKFVPGSTSGSISGNTVTWKLFGVESGRTDSVKVNVVIDSTLVTNTELNVQAELQWSSSTVSASKTFVVGNFPLLSLSIISATDVVGSGRTMTYRITVSNFGNIASANTQLYDTISTLGTFLNSSLARDSISSDKRLVKWNLGTLPAFSSKEIIVDVASQPNIGYETLLNSAFVYASNVSKVVRTSVANTIVPVIPKSISITPEPVYVFGRLNRDSSKITVVLKDSSNEVLPNGVIVTFSSTLGKYSNNQSTASATIQNGKAAMTLRSIDVANDIMRSTVTVIGGQQSFGTIQDTVSVYFYPGAVTGVVVSGTNRIPFQGARARVYNAAKKIVGEDITKADGKFFIALNKDVAKYQLEILAVDKFGDTISTSSEIDPAKFPLPAIVISNIISGRIEYKVTGQPVPAENVTVFLDSIAPAPKIRADRSSSARKLLNPNSLVRIREQLTDVKGKFKFEDLTPARYVIALDSVQFPNFNGYTLLSDTSSGTFTINLSLQIVLDSSVVLAASSPVMANAGDTINIKIGLTNSGTAEHRNADMSDTLSAFLKYVSATKGNFSSVAYDPATHAVRWHRDTLRTLDYDSVSVRCLVSRNIPDSTKINHRIWFKSPILSSYTNGTTTIRSSALIQFFTRFNVSKDTVMAGDSIRHVFSFKNIGTDSLRGIKIVDTLFSAGLSGIFLTKSTLDSAKIVDSISVVYIGSIAPAKEDSISLTLTTDFALRNGISVSSHAYMMKGDSILSRRDALFIVNENPMLSSFLKIAKTSNKKVAEIGDVVTYQVQISNASPQSMHSIGIYDHLPYAFAYVKNSARFNGKPIEPEYHPILNQLKWNFIDTLQPAKNATLVYQLAIGADAMESEGLNTAYASAVVGFGTAVVSFPSQWQVTVRPGVFTEKGLIIGKVFYDDNRNTFQDAGENGEKGIEIWMEDGTRITTGDDGKFSLSEVKPGQHVMRVNESTIPKMTELLAGNNAFAKDPTSRFVRVTEGGIAKANFYLKRNTADTLVQTLAKVNKLIAVRQLKPKYLYEDTLRKIKVDTVQMSVSFAYSGNKAIASIEINDQISELLRVVPNSFLYNGRHVTPIISGNNIQFLLGRGRDVTSGVVSYKAVLNGMPRSKTSILSSSTITCNSVDSIKVESNKIYVENVVLDTSKNTIEASEVSVSSSNPRNSNHLSDSVAVTAGDVVYFKSSLYIDPKKKIKSVKLLDTLESVFILNDRSYAVNGIPLPSRNLTVKIRSSALTSTAGILAADLDFVRVVSINLTDYLRSGLNEITYTATLEHAKKDTLFRKNAYAMVTDIFSGNNLLRANDAKIFVKAGVLSQALALETTYVDIQRQSLKVEEKIAEAVKRVESLGLSSSPAVVIEGISFETGKATLTSESKVVLDTIARILIAQKDINLQINGYTDNTGNASANRIMSLNRAKEVVAYLISKGIEKSRLLPQGFGPNNPVASNKTEEGRTKNRRVEFARMK